MSTARILDSGAGGGVIHLRVGDSSEQPFFRLQKKSRRTPDTTVGKGLHMQITSKKAPVDVFPLLLYVETDSCMYSGGVNALGLIKASAKAKGQSEVVRQRIPLVSSENKEGLSIDVYISVNVKKYALRRPKVEPEKRSMDILQENKRYLAMYSDLKREISELKTRMNKISPEQRVTPKAKTKASTAKPKQMASSGTFDFGKSKIDHRMVLDGSSDNEDYASTSQKDDYESYGQGESFDQYPFEEDGSVELSEEFTDSVDEPVSDVEDEIEDDFESV